MSPLSFGMLLATTSPTRLHALEGFYELFVVLPLGYNWEQEFQMVCNFSTGFDEIIFFHLDNGLGCWSHPPFPTRHTATVLRSMGGMTMEENTFSHLRLPGLFVRQGSWAGCVFLEGLLGILLLAWSSPTRCQVRADPDCQIKMDIAITHLVVVPKSLDDGQWLNDWRSPCWSVRSLLQV